MRERTTTVKMDERGRLYVPKPVREELGVEGEEVNVEITVRHEENDDSAFARRLSRKSIAEQYGDDYFGENPEWARELEDLGENA